ncbi:hypothetical protein ACLB2K_029931 [Fragaria x ananassa]
MRPRSATVITLMEGDGEIGYSDHCDGGRWRDRLCYVALFHSQPTDPNSKSRTRQPTNPNSKSKRTQPWMHVRDSTMPKVTNLEDALKTILGLLQIALNGYSLNKIIKCYCDLNQMGFGLSVLGTFFKLGFEPDVTTFRTLLNGFNFSSTVESRYKADLVTFNRLLEALYMDREPGTFTYNEPKVFDLMVGKASMVNVRSHSHKRVLQA